MFCAIPESVKWKVTEGQGSIEIVFHCVPYSLSFKHRLYCLVNMSQGNLSPSLVNCFTCRP